MTTTIKNLVEGPLKGDDLEESQRLPFKIGFSAGFSYAFKGLTTFWGRGLWRIVFTILIIISIFAVIIFILIAVGCSIMGVGIGVMVSDINNYISYSVTYGIGAVPFIILIPVFFVLAILTVSWQLPMVRLMTVKTEESMKGKDFKYSCCEEMKCPDVFIFVLYYLVVQFLFGMILGICYFIVYFFLLVGAFFSVAIIGIFIVIIVFICLVILGSFMLAVQAYTVVFISRGSMFGGLTFAFNNFLTTTGFGLGLLIMEFIPVLNLGLVWYSIVGATKLIIQNSLKPALQQNMEVIVEQQVVNQPINQAPVIQQVPVMQQAPVVQHVPMMQTIPMQQIPMPQMQMNPNIQNDQSMNPEYKM